MALGLKKTAKPTKKLASPPIQPSNQGAKVNTGHKFTARQAAFLDHYMISRNSSDAARKAGYAKKDANVQGPRLLANVRIRAELDRRIAAQADRLEVTADKVIREVAKVAFCDMRHYLGPDGLPMSDFSGLGPDETAAIESMTIEEFKDGRSDKREVRRFKFTLRDKVKSLELLMRKLGLTVERVEHDHKHSLTLMGLMLREIDAESRGKVIEHERVK